MLFLPLLLCGSSLIYIVLCRLATYLFGKSLHLLFTEVAAAIIKIMMLGANLPSQERSEVQTIRWRVETKEITRITIWIGKFEEGVRGSV